MDIVVADLCGPIFHKYISLLIDVKTGTVFVDIINKKSETTQHVIRWDTHAKTQTGKVLKRFHSDGGGEYRSNLLKSYFAKQGTVMTTTTRDTPQHNGIAERMNRTILETARAMLFNGQMHVSYWQDAVLTAVQLINLQVPTTLTAENMTRHEAWTGHKPSVSHLRVFGCDVYRHIMRDQRANKMSVTSRIGVFVGYDEEKNGYYKIWDPQERKLYRTRDVQFMEQQFTQAQKPKHTIWNTNTTTTTNTSSTNNNSIDIATDLYDMIVYKKSDETEQQNEMEHKYDEQIQAQEQEQTETEQDEKQEQEQEQEQELETDTSEIESEASESEARYPSRNRQAPESFAPLLRTDLMSAREMTNMTTQQQQAHNNNTVPANYQQAMSSDTRDKWIQAQEEEMKSHEQNNTWTVMRLPAGKHAIDCMWVYAVKLDEHGNIARHKARLVAKGFMQQYGIDYYDTYSAVMRYKSLRVMLMLVALMSLELVQMDVITAFLHADMEEEVYMKQPRGYQQDNNMVLKLNKSLYGTKQASHNWNGVLNVFILSVGFTRCTTDTCIYVKQSRSGQLMMIGVFVDDMPIAYHKQDEQEWTEIKHAFMTRFRMKDMGECKLILGMRITRDRSNNTLTIDNQVHIDNMLRTYGMQDCKHAPTPAAATQLTATTTEESGIVDIKLYQTIIGSLNYLVQTCRPDIAHAVNAVCRYGANPSPSHLVAAKRIMRYLAGTTRMGLTYKDKDKDKNKNKNDAHQIQITAFTDADWGGDHHDRKSTTGYVIKLNGCTISWATKKQQTVAISSTEAEYMAISAGAQELLWMQQFINELTQTTRRALDMSSTAILYCDNQSALAISRNDVHHHRTKHIDIKHHFIRDHVKAKRIDVVWIPTQAQIADVLTKPLDKIKFARFRHALLNITLKQQA
jgi:chemotaxis protein histidine kinase CheA